MQRGITYSFRVEGGNSPHNVQGYHPLVISTEVGILLCQYIIVQVEKLVHFQRFVYDPAYIVGRITLVIKLGLVK